MPRKSLTEGLDVGEKKSSSKSSEGKSESGGLTGGKIALIAGCFVVGALGIVYQMGLFDGKPTHAGKPVNNNGAVFTPKETKQIEDRKKLLDLPEGSPNKPAVGAS